MVQYLFFILNTRHFLKSYSTFHQAYGDHVHTAEALSSLGTLCAALGNVSGTNTQFHD